ncbi:hypothetical protein [Streptomyces sp. NPDC056730]|uniref:hypothetical protein n=1 Tax=unclassified Streptomyces TaxID=2593676 RepID=UPI003680B7A9
MPTTARLLTGTALAAAAIALTVAGTTAAVAVDRDGSWDGARDGVGEAAGAGGGEAIGEAAGAGGGEAVGAGIRDNSREGGWDSGRAGAQEGGRERGRPAQLELSPRYVRPGTKVVVRTTACGREGRGRGFAGSVGAKEFRLDRAAPKDAVAGEFRVARHARTGTHTIRVRCDNGREAHGALFVEHGGPSGHVRTGVGGSVTPDTTQIAAGMAILAGTAAGGTWLLRRRASGTQAS